MCQRAVRDRKLYFTKADKGGDILIFDADVFHNIISSVLRDEEKFTELPSDPRADIKSDIKHCIEHFEEGLLSKSEGEYKK